MLPSDEVSTTVSTAYIGADEVLRSRYLPDTTVGIKEAHHEHEVFGELLEKTLGQRRGLMLVDIRNVRSLSREAREFFGGEDSCALAVGLLTGSPLTRMVGNFFLRLSGTNHPTRLFTNEEKAVEWLSTLKGTV